MVQEGIPVRWFGEEGCTKVAGCVKVDVSVQEAHSCSGVVTLEFDQRMNSVDVADELFQGGFSVRPDEKDVVFVSHVELVPVVDSGVYVEALEAAHEQVGVTAGAFCAHCATFHLKILLIVEAEVVEI